MATKRERIRESINNIANPRAAGYPPLFVSASRTHHLCLLAANEGLPSTDYLRLVAQQAPVDRRTLRFAMLRDMEKSGLIARFRMGDHTLVFLDPSFAALKELRALLLAIGGAMGVRVGRTDRRWSDLPRNLPPAARPFLTIFGSESRTLAIVLPHLIPGVMQSLVRSQCGVSHANRIDLLEPLFRDGILAMHRKHFSVLGPNRRAPWARELQAFILRIAELEPDFMGRVRAIRAQLALYHGKAAVRRVGEEVFGSSPE